MAPIHCLFLFFFFCFSLFFLPSSSIVTIHFLLPLGFSPSLHHFFSKKITFLSFSTFLHSSPSIAFQILVFLVIFATHPFCETHFQTFFFFALPMASSSNRPSFLTFNGIKYHPSPEWNDEEGLLQDRKTHAPHSKLIFYFLFLFLISLLGNLLISCFIESFMLRHCHLIVVYSLLKFWTL